MQVGYYAFAVIYFSEKIQIGEHKSRGIYYKNINL